jgi:HSP20 family molecular chaperone IbpA
VFSGGDKSVSREFSRQIDIPPNVDPITLRSTLSKDGILQVEAPVAAPSYDKVRAIGADPGLRSSPALGPGLFYSGLSSVDPPAVHSQRNVATADANQSTFRIAVDIGADFEPGDLTVKTVDRKLIVHARHEIKTPGRTSCREFNREFDLPEGIDPQTVSASLGEDGRLVIEAPPRP